MILTHPVLFNTIVILFIAFTCGWLVSALNSKKQTKLRKRINELKKEREASRQQIVTLEEQLERFHTNSSTPVITFSAMKANKTS